jgi:alpha-1,2-glucosyltransferase
VKKGAAFLAAVLALHAAAFAAFAGHRVLVDEGFHYDQIIRFYNRSLVLEPYVTMIPAYHAVVAVLARFFSSPTVAFARWATYLLVLPLVFFFHRSLGPEDRDRAFLKTAQLAVLPPLLPFFWLIYTDGFSTAAVLAAFWAASRGWPAAAGLLGAGSMLVRQTNVVWLVFVWAWLYLRERGPLFSRERLFGFVRRTAVFACALAGFALFVVWNRGVAIGNRQWHPLGRLAAGNLWWMGFTTCVFFAPLIPSYFSKAVRSFSWKATAAVTAAFLALYLAAFPDLHFFNTWVQPDAYTLVRNHLLVAAADDPRLAAIYFTAAWMGTLAALGALEGRTRALWTAATCAYLVPQWLVEPRYTLIPFVFFQLFRRRQSDAAEAALLGWFALLSAGFYWGLWKGILL